MNWWHRMAAAMAGLSIAAAMLMPAISPNPGTTQAATVVPEQVEVPSAVAPAKPEAEGTGVQQKCHVHFNPLIETELRHSDLLKLQIVVDVLCREAIGDVSAFAEGRLFQKLVDVVDTQATLSGAVIINEDALERGFCVDVEVDSAGKETQLSQCFFQDDGEVVLAEG